jgi:hypothetical protein
MDKIQEVLEERKNGHSPSETTRKSTPSTRKTKDSI